MRNETRGTIAVQRRADMAEKFGGDTVDFPVGEDLIHAVASAGYLDRMPQSAAIKRYAQNLGVDLRDVIDTYLDGDELGNTQVKRFLTNTGLRPLFSPVVEDGLRLGMNRIAAQWEGLIARSIDIEQTTYEYYEFDNGQPSGQAGTGTDEYKMRHVAQGAPIPTARVTVSGKSYTLFKQGRGIEWTDESKSAPIDLAAMWFQQVGMQLGWDYFEQIVDMLLNGFFADGSDDAPVLATATAGSITDADLFTAVATHEIVYGYTPKVMLMSLARSVAIMTMENGAGQRVFPAGVTAAGLPPIQIAAQISDDKVVFVDTDFAMLRLVNRPFGTEFDRSPQSQVEGTYGTSIELVVPLFRYARLILDS
jgi:hypothetical protein